ncbi:MAG: DNA mismatch endonuclease Vsr [Acidobacteria bacterium]|nr:DNA mismatch endonuclease Vsr [Acidobacteriota bacterium]MYG74198.1 DNA mismatch endonuclease Vsr [Acidobacteriota bacterium]
MSVSSAAACIVNRDRRLADGPIDANRSALMRRIRGKNTAPERAVRQVAHSLGYRFRLHRRTLPGTPDMTFPRLRKVIFVHGCFWHRHPGCRRTTTPKTRTAYWQAKFQRNMERDRRNVASLQALGWDVLVVWECETLDRVGLVATLSQFLGGASA